MNKRIKNKQFKVKSKRDLKQYNRFAKKHDLPTENVNHVGRQWRVVEKQPGYRFK